jgi:hypothetical protein
MKKIHLNIFPLDVNKFRELEKAYNELLEELAKKGVIELEEEENELYKDNME